MHNIRSIEESLQKFSSSQHDRQRSQSKDGSNDGDDDHDHDDDDGAAINLSAIASSKSTTTTTTATTTTCRDDHLVAVAEVDFVTDDDNTDEDNFTRKRMQPIQLGLNT